MMQINQLQDGGRIADRLVQGMGVLQLGQVIAMKQVDNY
jgi:hypothetical protein